jgi:hypothetical protein
MNIKNHILSMAPEAQNMLLQAAVTDHRLDMLLELTNILEDQRDPKVLAELVCKMMKESNEKSNTST